MHVVPVNQHLYQFQTQNERQDYSGDWNNNILRQRFDDLIMLKMLPFHACGVLPTLEAISVTCPLMPSNRPVKLLMIPLTSKPLSHSVILSQIKFKGILLLSGSLPN